jgi:hypothetical protein
MMTQKTIKVMVGLALEPNLKVETVAVDRERRAAETLSGPVSSTGSSTGGGC